MPPCYLSVYRLISSIRGVSLRFAFRAAALAAAASLTGCGAPANSPATVTLTVTVLAPSTASPPNVSLAPATATVGQEVRDGVFAFTVSKVDPPTNSIDTQTASGKYVVVHLTVTNIGDAPQQFWEIDQALIDKDGRQYKYDTMATVFSRGAGKSNWINPGSTLESTVVFDIPAGAQPASIELHDSGNSPGVTVDL